MNKTKSFLCLDFGAGTLKAAEFEPNEAGSLVLKQYGVKPLGLPGSQEAARENILKKSVPELLADRGFASRASGVCAPGFHVFSKFVKLPPVDTSKVTQIIQYEAQQNVPFPLEEVVWDYQIIGTTASNELEVLLVAIKADVVEGLFRTGDATGLKIEQVDVSLAALGNAFRYNYGDVEECVMLLDIGAKTSNLLFFEKGKFYGRGINIGANSITQEFAAEGKLRFPEAEQIKIAEGFVGLGGAYEEPENPHQAAISKIARQVMTRLHIQVNQTIQFYRGQQGGGAPTQLFLAGGGSVMPYCAQFFAEKLNLPVDYFNPFRNVQIDPSINVEELATVAHGFGEVVGLGLRKVVQCPVELNLVPKTVQKKQQFAQKQPYFIAAVFSVVLAVFAFGWFYDRLASVKAANLARIEEQARPLKQYETQLRQVETQLRTTKSEVDLFTVLGRQRIFWADVLTELRDIMLQAEEKVSRPGMPAGVWIAALGVDPETLKKREMKWSDFMDPDDPRNPYRMDPRMAERYGFLEQEEGGPGGMRGYGGYGGGPLDNLPVLDSEADAVSTNAIIVTMQAVNMSRYGDMGVNSDLIYTIEELLRNSELFDPSETKAHKIEEMKEGEKTFTFSVTLMLKEPFEN